MGLFSRVWDENQPLDSSEAALLGQDLRNLKTDIRQRLVYFGMGTLAERGTPDGTAVWGLPTAGVMYLATDTGQYFQWDGTQWVDHTPAFGGGSSLLLLTPPGSTITGNGTDQSVYKVTISSSLFTNNGGFKVFYKFVNINGVAMTVRVRITNGVSSVYSNNIGVAGNTQLTQTLNCFTHGVESIMLNDNAWLWDFLATSFDPTQQTVIEILVNKASLAYQPQGFYVMTISK